MSNLITIEISNQEIDDILDAAFYDGISYWAGIVGKVKDGSVQRETNVTAEALTRGWAVKLHDHLEDVDYKLTKTKFLIGIGLAVRNGYADLNDIDANAADACVQYALFGEVRYS